MSKTTKTTKTAKATKTATVEKREVAPVARIVDRKAMLASYELRSGGYEVSLLAVARGFQAVITHKNSTEVLLTGKPHKSQLGAIILAAKAAAETAEGKRCETIRAVASMGGVQF